MDLIARHLNTTENMQTESNGLPNIAPAVVAFQISGNFLSTVSTRFALCRFINNWATVKQFDKMCFEDYGHREKKTFHEINQNGCERG